MYTSPGRNGIKPNCSVSADLPALLNLPSSFSAEISKIFTDARPHQLLEYTVINTLRY